MRKQAPNTGRGEEGARRRPSGALLSRRLVTCLGSTSQEGQRVYPTDRRVSIRSSGLNRRRHNTIAQTSTEDGPRRRRSAVSFFVCSARGSEAVAVGTWTE
uniref:Uncharacterized protein n=1 Tax=Steinernema glaseri TaxID=37863 RepID=A0A1I7Y1T9_9BILA